MFGWSDWIDPMEVLGPNVFEPGTAGPISGTYELHHVLGNTDAMLDLAEEVAAKDFQYRMTIIDKAWDGIGDWYA